MLRKLARSGDRVRPRNQSEAAQLTKIECRAAENRRPKACCQLQESDFENNELPQSHIWIWVVVGMAMFCAWIVVLQYLQYSLAEAINLRNISVAQYAVLVSNVGDVKCDEGPLEAFGRMYGDVVSTFYVRDFGRLFAKDAEVFSPHSSASAVYFLGAYTFRRSAFE